MKRSPLNRVGKIGEANREARKKIAEIAAEKLINYCELQLGDTCLKWQYLAPAHRHKRSWYKGDVAKLADFKQWVASCVVCHDFIETKPIFTEELFMQLRGKE